MWNIIYFAFMLVQINSGQCADFTQERSKIEYFNPKYTKDVSIITSHETPDFLTSMNCTTLIPFSNNLTWRFEFYNLKISDVPLKIDFKACDGLKQDWLRNWLDSHSNIPMDLCPIPPGVYYIKNIEFPPKNLPLSLKNVDYYSRISVFMTSTKEKVLEVTIDLKSNKIGA